jgi:phage terminase large subunit-like protein
MTCKPRWATPATPGRPNLAPKIKLTGRMLGFDLMDWQRQVNEVATEQTPEGRFAYRQVVLEVMRQQGKSVDVLSMMVTRALLKPGTQIAYTAQTRLDAVKRLLDTWWPRIASSPVGEIVTPRRASGKEAWLFANGSMIAVMATQESSGHGDSLDLAVIDEAWTQKDSHLEQALRPAMMTRDAQLWIVSAAGTDASAYFRDKVDAGRARVESGVPGSGCYIGYAAAEDADPADPATWRGCMPALGHTLTEDTVRADFELMDLRDFRRGYLCQWLDGFPLDWQVIPKASWEALKAAPVAHGDVAISADVTPARTAATIAAAWRRPDGCMDVEIVDHRPGTSWLVKRLTEIVRRHRPAATVIDAAGPAGSLIDELEAQGIEVVRPTVREVAQGCGRFYDMVMDSGVLRHNDDAALNAAVAGAVKRDLGDGWAWARKMTAIDISPLVGATLAVWAHDRFATRRPPYELLRSVS